MTRTGASLLAAGALVCGCGGVRVAHATAPVKGTVRYCATEPGERAAVSAFNRAHEREGLSVRLTMLTGTKRFMAALKRGRCDVVELGAPDVAYFASAGTLRDLTAHVRERRREFVPATLRSGHYARKDWALPLYVDVPLLFSHTWNLPRTLQALYRRGGLAYGDGPDSPLGFLETAYAAGGRVLTPDGRRSALDSPQNRAALALIVSALAHRTVTGGTAPVAFRRFVRGPARFMRNWAGYVGDKRLYSDRVLALAPLPPFAGAGQATLILGEDLAVTRAARNVPAALAFIDARTSPAGVRHRAGLGYMSPLVASYGDDERPNMLAGGYVMRALRHAATPPVTPHFAEIIKVLAATISAARTRHMSVERALRKGSRAIDAVLANAAPGEES